MLGGGALTLTDTDGKDGTKEGVEKTERRAGSGADCGALVGTISDAADGSFEAARPLRELKGHF